LFAHAQYSLIAIFLTSYDLKIALENISNKDLKLTIASGKNPSFIIF